MSHSIVQRGIIEFILGIDINAGIYEILHNFNLTNLCYHSQESYILKINLPVLQRLQYARGFFQTNL